MSPKIVDGSPSSPSQPVEPKRLGKCGSLPPGGHKVGKGDRFVPDQMVVTGKRGAIEAILNRLRVDYPLLAQRPIEEIDLEDLRRRAQPGAELAFSSALEPDRVVMQVYQLPDGLTLEDAIVQFYQRVSPDDPSAFAEPNYLIGNPDIAGNSGCIEGGPAGSPEGNSGESEFWKQWAFGQDGINLWPREGKGRGKGARVVVFDTSPFDDSGLWEITWMECEPFRLCVSHPRQLVELEPEDSEVDLRDHGLFAAGLVHAVAPDSDIHLVRVLNKDNKGDLGTLVKALCDLMLQRSRGGPIKLERTVLNLSLGLNGHPDREKPWLHKLQNDIKATNAVLGLIDDRTKEDEIPVVYLQIVLDIAQQAGAIIVAASGNQSGERGPVEEMMIPASYESVIGVAGHNKERARSSFSNKGDIAAPGGGKLSKLDLFDKNNQPIPECWLVGLSMISEPLHGYMYWMGTSFAAPLVAGEAALGLGKGDPPGQVDHKIKSTVIPANPHGDPNLGKGCAQVPL